MTIKRDRYLNRLVERRHNGFVKIITGIRRCGKSFLLFRLFRERLIRDGVSPSQIVEIALDMKKFSDGWREATGAVPRRHIGVDGGTQGRMI